MKLKAQVKKLAAIAAAGLLVVAMLPGCQSSDAVAGTVNGESIYEKDVTTYIQMIRASYGLTDDTQWSSYLTSSGMTAETLRESIINQQAREVLVKKAASEAGISVDQTELDTTMSNLKNRYEQSSTGGWSSFLSTAGLSESDVRSLMEQSLLDQAVSSQMLDVSVSDEDVQSAIDENISTYNGAKKSSHILFASTDKETAEQVLQQLKDGADFAEMAKQYSTDTGSASDGGNVGWDKATSFVTEYQTALDGLSKGEMTQELVESTYGYHIILCTDEFSYEDGATLTKDDIPSDIYETIYNDKLSEVEEEAFTEYADGLMENADVQVNAMPSGLPYDV